MVKLIFQTAGHPVKGFCQIAEFLAYKIRSGAVSQEGGDKIWRVALEHPEKVDAITDILDMDLPEDETLAKVERLVS